jgi:hypothetical protein
MKIFDRFQNINLIQLVVIMLCVIIIGLIVSNTLVINSSNQSGILVAMVPKSCTPQAKQVNQDNQAKPEITQAPQPEPLTNTSANKLVLYYTEWCGYSQQFLPVWNALKKMIANKSSNLILTQEYDCDKFTNICEQNNIGGFPTLILHKSDGTKIKYTDARDADTIMSFLVQNNAI